MRYLFFILCFFGCVWMGFSQDGIYKFNHLTSTEGLSENSVLAITQDKLGQMWIGTRDGLNKYDGKEFTVYRTDKNNPLSISHNDILCLEEDSKGYIWVGTSYGLNKFDPKKDTFKTYFSKKGNSSIAGNSIWTIKELANKEIWIGTPAGLSIYNPTTDSFLTIMMGQQVLSILETKKGEIFIGTKNGLKQIIRAKANKFQIVNIKGTDTVIVQSLIESPNGNILIGTKNQSVLEYNKKLPAVMPYFAEQTLKGKNKNVRQLLYGKGGNLWIGTYNGLQVADVKRKITSLTNDINDNATISDNFVKALYKDKKGSIWIGTYNGGINIWDESNINFVTITQKAADKGLAYKVVSSIVNYDNHLYFGTEGGGISILSTKSRSIEHINSRNSQLKFDNVKSLYVSKDKKLWIGFFEGGIMIYNLVTKQFDTTILSKELLAYIDGFGVNSIEQNSNGEMLLGTVGAGLIRYNATSKLFKVVPNDVKNNGLTNDYIRTVKVDSKNNIWISTLQGLNKIDPKGKVSHFFYNLSESKGDGTTAVFEDSKGIIWVGTDINGLFKYLNGTFVSVELKFGTTVVIGVRSIEEDEKGLLWISTVNQGIINYNPKTNLVIANYTQKEGLASNQFNNNASLNLGKSGFYFGGVAGADYFNANKLIKNTYAPQVIIADFKIKNKSISVNDDNKLLSNTISYTKKIELSYLEGNFDITFSIPNFINSSSNHYVYRLKGLDNDWIETNNNSVSYTIQTPGNYIFEVKGINSDGVSNEVPTVLEIQVAAAPWRTWWAFLLYALFIIAALYYLLDILKSKERLRHELVLEQNETEQNKALNLAKLEFFTNISHEFRTPLTLILGPLQQILDNYKGSSIMFKKLKVVESNANHLLQLINRLMDFRKLENKIVKLEAAEGNIVKFLREIYLSFSEYAKDGNYDYIFQSSAEEIKVYYDRYKLEQVFFNLISNAFRYTPSNGKIVIRVTEKRSKIIIQIEDTGVGIAKEYHDKIFERFFEVAINNKPNNDYNKGTGIGLSIVKNIVDLHKGIITVKENENGIGTIFCVEIPRGRHHLSDTEILSDFKFSDDISQYVNQIEEPEVVLEEDILENMITDDKPTILLVEDNVELRQFMRDLLIKKYNILEAENGEVAYKIALQKKVDVIISDVVMPVMTGTELCALIKEDIRTSHIPVILLTSRSSLIFKLEGLESGADDYISKPFNVLEFDLRVKNLLSSSTRLKQKMTSTDSLQVDEIILSSLDEKLYKKALQIVDDNIGNEQFDIHFFCQELGVSRTVLFKKVKAWTDFTPNEFVQHIRLMKGAQLLEQEKISISEISYALGFKNPKYFSKCFSKKFGKTPTEYSKKFTDY